MCRAFPWNAEREAQRRPRSRDVRQRPSRVATCSMVVLLPSTLCGQIGWRCHLNHRVRSLVARTSAAGRQAPVRGAGLRADRYLGHRSRSGNFGIAAHALLRRQGRPAEALFDAAWVDLNARVKRATDAAPSNRDSILNALQTVSGVLARDPDLATLFLFEGRRLRGARPRVHVSKGSIAFAEILTGARAESADRPGDRPGARRRRHHVVAHRGGRSHDSRSALVEERWQPRFRRARISADAGGDARWVRPRQGPSAPAARKIALSRYSSAARVSR